MKNVIVTGASSGIGECTARMFSEQGYRVILVGRNIERLTAISKNLPNENKFYQVDLQSSDEIKKFSEDVALELSGGLHALINNAGIVEYGPLQEYPLEGWNKQFQVNLFSAVELSNLMFKHLAKQKPSFIVNISSSLGFKPIANTSAYSASKAAMNSWTKSAALEWAEYGIRVNAINPGIVNTPIHGFFGDGAAKSEADKAQPLQRAGEPFEIAAMASFLCQKPSEWTTGSLLTIDGGIQLL